MMFVYYTQTLDAQGKPVALPLAEGQRATEPQILRLANGKPAPVPFRRTSTEDGRETELKFPRELQRIFHIINLWLAGYRGDEIKGRTPIQEQASNLADKFSDNTSTTLTIRELNDALPGEWRLLHYIRQKAHNKEKKMIADKIRNDHTTWETSPGYNPQAINPNLTVFPYEGPNRAGVRAIKLREAARLSEAAQDNEITHNQDEKNQISLERQPLLTVQYNNSQTQSLALETPTYSLSENSEAVPAAATAVKRKGMH